MELDTLKLILALLLHLFTVNAQEQERCRKNVDLGFLMDSSGSIGDQDYQKEKDFVKALASTFILSRRNTQAGVIIYSDDAQIYSTFGQYPDIETFKWGVDSLPYLRKRTRIDKALKLASTRLFTEGGGARPDKEDIMVILTDGVQTPDPDAVPLVDAVRPLHEAGVRVFAIGVGGHYNRSELLQLVRRPSDVYEASDFDELLLLVKRIARGTCAPAPVIVPKCRYRADLGFVMDASNSIGITDFQKERDFVHSLASAFTFGRNETAAAVITYSDFATLNIPLGQHYSAERFRQAVERIPYTLGRTRIDKALNLASTDIFSDRGGSRPGLPKLMVILTDGKQTPDPDAIPPGAAVIPLQNKGVTIFAVGVGSKIDHDELRSMVQRDDDVFTATDFDDLLNKAYQISERTCEDVQTQIENVDGGWSPWQPWDVCIPSCGGGLQTRRRVCESPFPQGNGLPCQGPASETRACNQQPCRENIKKCTARADIGFVMDASASIGEFDFQKERDFVKAVADSFTLASDQAIVGVITYSDDAKLDIPLGQYMSADRFKLEVDRIPYILGRTRIDKALKLANTGFFGENGGSRAGFPKIMIILTDGVQTPDPDAIPLDQAVIPLRQAGVRVFAVGIGGHTRPSELRLMVDRPDDVFMAADFDDLLQKTYQIAERTCQEIERPEVDGSWSSWEPWDVCIPSCGGGQQSRRRKCNNPPPANGGRECPGASIETRACNQQPCPENLKKCTARADIGFVMDASASIGKFDFQKERDFVKAVADSFTLASDQAIVGVITYSDDAKLDIPLGQYMSADRFKLEVDRIPYILGRTRIDKALKLAKSGFFGENGRSRPGFPKIMIILTDGVQTPDPDAIPLDQAVIPLRQAGVRVFAVGIGGHTRPSELRLMVDRPDDVFMADDFDDLLEKTYQIAERTCQEIERPGVDGEWSSWQKWDKCIPECGGGQQTRRRLCNNPSPANGGRECPGSSSESRACNQQPCIGKIQCSQRIDLAFLMDASGSIGKWDFQKERDFVKAMAASFTFARDQTLAAVITYSDKATLEIPFGQYLNTDRFRLEVDQIRYTLGQTRIDKALAAAAEKVFAPDKGTRPGFPKVIVILTDGVQTKDPDTIPLRQAVLPLRRKGVQIIAVGVGGHTDPDELRQMVARASDVYTVTDFDDLLKKAYDIAGKTCDSASRPRVNGEWSAWSAWTTCSAACGRGQQNRKRHCDNPFPSNGGYPCSGPNEELRSCFLRPCSGKIDGGWSDWSRWSRCSVTCGTGVASRQRRCDNPLPSNGGNQCSGRRQERRVCYQRPCGGNPRVDGGWSDWSRWSRCSVTCGTGVASRQRRCDNPLPSNGGRQCSGRREDRRICYRRPCDTRRRVDGQWSTWSAWRQCTRTCGGGFQSRNRDCSNPPPSNGGQDCYGRAQESQPCGTRPCPGRRVDGQWSAWSAWRQCTRTCGGGFQSRNRDCSNPPPSNGGRDCFGRAQESQPCGTRPCPGRRVDGQWSAWSAWRQCTRTCGGGFQSRNRDCSNPPPSNGGQDCYGRAQESQPCGTRPCPGRRVDGQWAPWSDWVQCSTTCGGGVQSRFRACSNPPPSNGGRECPGIRQESRLCSTLPCSVPITTSECRNLDAMVGILMVSSRSVGQANFQKQKEFVKRVAASYGLSSTGSRAGIIGYSDSAQVYARMGEHTDQASFEQAVERVIYTRGTSRVDKALRLASLRFFPSSGVVTFGVPRILIVLVNEPLTREFDTVPLNKAVRPLRIANVKVFVIGIGQQVNRNELNIIADVEKDVFLARDFDDLLRRSSQIISSSCSGYLPKIRPSCLGTSDLGFILDASGSVGRAGFNKQRQFVTSVSTSFDVGPSSTHIGVITYGGFAVVRLRFGEFTSMDQITRAVSTIPYTRGQSRIEEALKQATNDLYTVGGGARWGLPKIAIILSDGLQVRNPDVELRQASEALRRAGVKIIVVGIGNDRDSDNLRLLVNSNKHVVIVRDYDELLRRANEIALLTCNGVRGPFPTYNPGNIGSCPKMDLGFAMDSSSELGIRNYLKEKDFVKRVATHVGIGPDGSRVGVLIYGDTSMVEIRMLHHRDSRSFGSLVDRLPYYSQRRRIDTALKTAKFMFKVPPQKSRVSKVLVLIVNGKQTYTYRSVPLDQAVQPLRDAGVRVIVIGVGNVSANQLRSVTESPRDVYLIPNFDILLSQVDNFKRIVCEAGARFSRRG